MLRNVKFGIFLQKGILYVDKSTVGWQPVAKAWLDTRSNLETSVSIMLSISGDVATYKLKMSLKITSNV